MPDSPSEDPQPRVTIEETDAAEKIVREYAPLLVVRGVIGILAGIVLLFWPGTGLAVAAIALGLFLAIDGVERLVAVLRRPRRAEGSEVPALVGAFLRITFGAVVLFNPTETGGIWASLIFIIAGMNLVIGSLVMFWKGGAAFRDDGMAVGTAVLMLLLGLFMVLLPMISALFLLRILGAILVLAAVPSLAVGLRSR